MKNKHKFQPLQHRLEIRVACFTCRLNTLLYLVLLYAMFNVIASPISAQMAYEKITTYQQIPKLPHHTNHLYDHSEWSHDGQKIAFMMHDLEDLNTTTIWIHNLITGTTTPLTHPDTTGCIDIMPTWSPDDQYIAFGSNRGGEINLYTVSLADGALRKITEKLGIGSGWDVHPSWSPDGKRLAYGDLVEENLDIYVYNLLDDTTKRLTVDEASDKFPSWSPDGQSILYVSDRDKEKDNGDSLWLLDFSTGEKKKFDVDLHNISDHVWSPDGKWIAVNNGNAGGSWSPQCWIVSSAGGEARLVEAMDAERYWNWTPSWSPDGKFLVYSSMPALEQIAQMAVYDVQRSTVSILAEEIVSTRFRDWTRWCSWSPDGKKIVYSTPDPNAFATGKVQMDTTLYVIGSDGKSESVLLFSGRMPDWSADSNQLAFLTTGEQGGEIGIYNFDKQQINYPLKEMQGLKDELSFSPDGELIAYINKFETRDDLWIYDTVTKDNVQLTFDGEDKWMATWSLEGDYIAYMARKAGTKFDIWYVPSFGGQSIQLTKHMDHDAVPVWSVNEPDKLYYESSRAKWELWSTSTEGGEEFVFSGSKAIWWPMFMNDTGQLFYVSHIIGQDNLATANLVDGEEKLLTHTGDIHFPVASPDGQKIIFQKANLEDWKHGALRIQNVSNILTKENLP